LFLIKKQNIDISITSHILQGKHTPQHSSTW